MCIYMYVYIYIYVYTFMYVHVFICFSRACVLSGQLAHHTTPPRRRCKNLELPVCGELCSLGFLEPTAISNL